MSNPSMFAPDGGSSLVDADRCPICGDIRIDGYCLWEDYDDEDLTQAMTIDNSNEHASATQWWGKVLIHYHRDEALADLRLLDH